MSEGTVEVVRSVYEAWSRNDLPGPAHLFDEQIEYVNPPDAVEPGTRRGLPAFSQAVHDVFEGYENWQIELERLVPSGEQVAVVVRYRVHWRTSGSRCRTHERERNRRHRSEHKLIYNTRKWTFTRRRVLFERPLCERCGAIATDVHHRDGYEDPYALDGLEPLCHSCHSRATRAEQLDGGLR